MAERVHKWGFGAALLFLTLVGLMVTEGVETRPEVQSLRVRDERHARSTATLAVVVLFAGIALQVLYSNALRGTRPEVGPEPLANFLGFALLAPFVANYAVTRNFRVYGFASGPLFRSARAYYGQGTPGGCAVNVGVFTLCALMAVVLPLPLLVPGLLLLAYAFLLARAGLVAAKSA